MNKDLNLLRLMVIDLGGITGTVANRLCACGHIRIDHEPYEKAFCSECDCAAFQTYNMNRREIDILNKVKELEAWREVIFNAWHEKRLHSEELVELAQLIQDVMDGKKKEIDLENHITLIALLS